MNPPSTLITVNELTCAIKNQLESRFTQLAVKGEITNAKLHSSGHLYFDLKDSEAKIGAVMFRPQCQLLKSLPKEGDQVVVKGGITLYPPHGKYQLIARTIEHLGLGELLLKFENLKKKLQHLGWFDSKHKKPLPKFPRTIGVVTSPTGAVIKDIIHILTRRVTGFHLILYPVRVQGAEAANEIAQAITAFNRYNLADVLIVGRGGGSLEDLWAFNEESVAKAIFDSRIPVISAVGHETDITLADFVADIRAPTPSAAAEMVSAEKAHHLALLNKIEKNLTYSCQNKIKHLRLQILNYKRHPLLTTSYGLLAAPLQKLDEIKEKIDESIKKQLLKLTYALAGGQKQLSALKPTAKVSFCRLQLRGLEERIGASILYSLHLKKQRLKEILERLHALDPKNVLKRGYSILFSEKRKSVIVSAQSLTSGEDVRALLPDGEAILTVK